MKSIFTLWIMLSLWGSGSAQIKTLFYHSEAFGIQEGLEHGVVIDMFIDRQGFVWVHTHGQIQIFDGKNFVPVHHQIPGPTFIGRFSASLQDDIFFVTMDAVYKFDPMKWDRQTSRALSIPAANGSVHSPFFLYENEQFLFVAHPNDSVYQIRKSDLQFENRFKLPVSIDPSSIISEITPRVAMSDQIEYKGIDQQLYAYSLSNGRLDTLHGARPSRSCIKTSRDTFVCIDDENLYVLTPGKVETRTLPDTTQVFFGKYIMHFAPDKVLVALSGSIFTFDLKSLQWVSRFQRTGEGRFYDIKIRMMKHDAAGNAYITSFTTGFSKLYPKHEAFDYIGSNVSDKRFVHHVEGSDPANAVILATIQDGLYLFDTTGNMIEQYIEFPCGGVHYYISNIVKVSPTTFLILTDQKAYVLTLNGSKSRLRCLTSYDPEWMNYYSMVIKGKAPNQFYVTSWNGLLEIQLRDDFTFTFHPDHPLATRMAIAPFRKGFLASGADTMIYIDQDMKQVIRRFSIPRLGSHRCILAEDSSHVLLGTDVGLFRLTLSTEARILDTLYTKLVYAILPSDSARQYWFSTDYGLFKLGDDGTLTNYSIESGIQENEFNTNACYTSESGKMYFGGINGVTSFFPSEVNRLNDTIMMYVRSLSVNQETVAHYMAHPEDSTWVFANNESHIGIDLLGKGRRSPRSYNYQYLIPQLGPEWVNMGQDSRIQFHLSPGVYTMYYHIDNSYNPNAIPARYLRWEIRPPFYKTWWFIALTTLMILGVVTFVLNLYRRRQELKLTYELELGQRIQHERIRISRELHDNIGAQMATVKRNLNFLVHHRDRLSENQRVEKMQHLEEIASGINQELRDTIWVTQHAQISVGDFINRLKAYIFQVLGAESPIRVSYDEKCDPRVKLGPFVALNLHRICQEAINNIVKHACATEMRLTCKGDDRQLTVILADNGLGYDATRSYEGYGLNNMRKRAEQIGAALYFNREGTPGSQLEIILPHLTTTEMTER